MKKFKSFVSLLIAALILFSFSSTAFSEYNKVFINDKYVTEVENQGSAKDCIYYALLSAAGSYCMKYYGISASQANFSESRLKDSVGEYTNFGYVLYESVKQPIGSDYFISGIESLTGRGERYIKQKIKENGAVCAAFALPDGGMTNENYYDKEKATFYCPEKSANGKDYHAVCIVGWDDDVDNDDFKYNIVGNGAWLCKNSYGGDYGDGGYFWLSYGCKFTYAAAVEVSRMTGITAESAANINNISESHFPFLNAGYITCAGFRYYRCSDEAEVTVFVNGKTAVNQKTKLVNGYNFIEFPEPVKTGSIIVKVDCETVPSNSVTCYVTLFKSFYDIDRKPPAVDDSWLVVLNEVKFKYDGESFFAYSSTDKTVTHNVKYESSGNGFIITPCDGYAFSENVSLIDVSYSDDAVSSWECKNGSIVVTSGSNGKCYVNGVNLITGDDGAITNVIPVFGSSPDEIPIEAKTEVICYSDEEMKTPVDDIRNLDKYYVSVRIDGYYGNPEGVNVYVNGDIVGECEGRKDNIVIVTAEIDIPEVIQPLLEFFTRTLPSLFASFISAFTKSL